MSGLFVDGSKSTTISQYDLWAKRTNDAGGLMLSKYNKKVPVEIVYYDGRFDINETTKLTEKLILDDKDTYHMTRSDRPMAIFDRVARCPRDHASSGSR